MSDSACATKLCIETPKPPRTVQAETSSVSHYLYLSVIWAKW